MVIGRRWCSDYSTRSIVSLLRAVARARNAREVLVRNEREHGSRSSRRSVSDEQERLPVDVYRACATQGAPPGAHSAGEGVADSSSRTSARPAAGNHRPVSRWESSAHPAGAGGSERGRIVPASEARGKQRVERSEVSPASIRPRRRFRERSERKPASRSPRNEVSRNVSPGKDRAQKPAGRGRFLASRGGKPPRRVRRIFDPARSSKSLLLRDSEPRPIELGESKALASSRRKRRERPGAFEVVLVAVAGRI